MRFIYPEGGLQGPELPPEVSRVIALLREATTTDSFDTAPVWAQVYAAVPDLPGAFPEPRVNGLIRALRSRPDAPESPGDVRHYESVRDYCYRLLGALKRVDRLQGVRRDFSDGSYVDAAGKVWTIYR